MSNIPSLDEYGQKPLGVSWSRIHEYEKCQQRVVFRMQGKGDTVKDGRRFIHGTLADRAMRKWLDQEDGTQEPGQMAQYVDDLWHEIVYSDEYKITWKGDPVEDQAYVRDLAKTVVNNVEPFLLARVLPYEYEPELRFRIPLQIPDSHGFGRTILLNGGMDIAVRDPATGLVSIYDLKATKNEYYIQHGMVGQLIFYGIAWTLMTGTPMEDIRCAFLTPATKNQYHELSVSAVDRRNLMKRIIRFANAIWDEEKPLCADNKNECWGCEMKSICPLWANVVLPEQPDGKHRISLTGSAEVRKQAKEASDGN